jgi:Uma2 family endonuclease
MLLRRDEYAYRVLTEARMGVRGGDDKRRRYRIPDMMVAPVLDNPTRIVLEQPLMVLEILSPDDCMSDVVRKCADYEEFGIPQIWVVDPESREVWMVRGGIAREVAAKAASFRAAERDVVVDFNEAFASPDFV